MKRKSFRSNKRVLPPKKRYKVLKFLVVVGLIALVLLAIWIYLHRPNVRINDGGGILVPTATDEPTVRIVEPLYQLDFPADWKEISRRDYPYKVVTWKGTARESAARTIDVYVDKIPEKLEINRLLPVSSRDDRLTVDPASGNCVFFNEDTAKLTPEQATKQPVRKLEWQGIAFMCDIPNSLRNVVATGSKEGLNQVSLTGEKGGKHRYFIVYTDHSAHPNEQTFPAVLRSFRAL